MWPAQLCQLSFQRPTLRLQTPGTCTEIRGSFHSQLPHSSAWPRLPEPPPHLSGWRLTAPRMCCFHMDMPSTSFLEALAPSPGGSYHRFAHLRSRVRKFPHSSAIDSYPPSCSRCPSFHLASGRTLSLDRYIRFCICSRYLSGRLSSPVLVPGDWVSEVGREAPVVLSSSLTLCLL